MVDLHIHSNYSDGEMSVAQIIELAKSQNLKSIAITDHYSLDAHLEKNSENIELIPGLEISVEILNTQIHLIGLLFNIYDPDLNKFIKQVHFIRNKSMVNLGLELIQKGITVPQNPYNCGMTQYVMELVKINKSIPSEYLKNLIYNSKYYIKYRKQINVEPKKAINLIHKAHGVVIIPHINMIPFKKRESIIKQLVEYGVDGMETIYPTYSDDDKVYAQNICKKYNLLESGGSDFHGKLRKDNIMGFDSIPDTVLEKMKTKRKIFD